MLQSIVNGLKKLVASLEAYLEKQKPIVPLPIPPMPTPPVLPDPPHISQIPSWASGIQNAEGWSMSSASFRNCNPGNIKYGDYAKELGATGPSPVGFAVFPSYEAGRKALIQFLTDACTDKLIAFKNTMTLEQFTQIYAEPQNLTNYVNVVCKSLKVGTTGKITIRELL